MGCIVELALLQLLEDLLHPGKVGTLNQSNDMLYVVNAIGDLVLLQGKKGHPVMECDLPAYVDLWPVIMPSRKADYELGYQVQLFIGYLVGGEYGHNADGGPDLSLDDGRAMSRHRRGYGRSLGVLTVTGGAAFGDE